VDQDPFFRALTALKVEVSKFETCGHECVSSGPGIASGMTEMEQALALVRLTRREALAAAVVVGAGFAVGKTVASPKTITFPARRNGNIQQVFWVPEESAMIICDMWNDHWCKHAAARTSELAPKVDAFASRLRPYGVLIVHSPSDTMDFYTGTPQRNRA